MYAICEVVQEFDGDLCWVKKVLQVFPDTMSAYKALYIYIYIFEPGRYGDYDTVLRVVHEQDLNTRFR